MIARRMRAAELATLKQDEAVLWLKSGGTNYQTVYFVRLSQERTGWCWVRRSLDSPAMKAIKLSSVGQAGVAS
jgi:hypothetical protein